MYLNYKTLVDIDIDMDVDREKRETGMHSTI